MSSASALLWSVLRCGAETMPEVSVVIPVYNAGRIIDTALTSVLAQTFGDIEVVVVDNGSTDDTAARAQARGPMVTCVRQPHGGRSNAWNSGLLAARGRLIAFMEPTSVWAPRSENGSSQRRKSGRKASWLCMYTPRILPAQLSRVK